MKNIITFPIVIYVLGLCLNSFALQELDRLYSFRKIAAVVVNAKDEPVHGEHVEGEMVRLINQRMMFDWHDKGYSYLKNFLLNKENVDLGNPQAENLDTVQVSFPELSQMGVNALILARISSKTEKDKEVYSLFFVFVIPETKEVIKSFELQVKNALSLDSFTAATREAIRQMIKGIPFDASILSREGYRVVIDAGYPKMQVGRRLPVYTMESEKGEISFAESGTVEITRVDKNLSFGKVIVEKKPYEVSVSNKLRFKHPRAYRTRLNVGYPGKKRELSSIEKLPPVKKGSVGNMTVTLGGSLVNHSITPQATDQTGVSQGAFYPGGMLRSEIWLTKRIFFDLGFRFASAVLTSSYQVNNETVEENLNSSLTAFHGQVGYKLNFSDEVLGGPTVYGKLGLATYRFTIDQARNPKFFGNASYKGLALGVGADLPVNRKFGLGIEVNTLLFASLDEGQQTSGAEITHAAGFDFAVRSYYNLTADMDIEGKLLFNNFSAQFSGDGARTTDLASSSRSSKAFQIGVSYYF